MRKHYLKSFKVSEEKSQCLIPHHYSKRIINKKLKSSSKSWLLRHINDRFVQAAKVDGYLSRAVYKLIEINDKYRILYKGLKNTIILDLGCVPGSWLQFISNSISLNEKSNNFIIGVDLLEMDISIIDAQFFRFIQSDIESDHFLSQLVECTNGKKIDVIFSDVLHNNTGDSKSDQILNERMLSSIFHLVKNILNSGGTLVCKAIGMASHGETYKEISNCFKMIQRFKPKSSRQNSNELYIVAKGFKGN